MKEIKPYDIAITGGGLAGLSLAILSADAGYNVVLFEKENYPFHKVCGEYISFESWNFLEQLGLPLLELNLPSIKQLNISDIKGNIYNFNLPLGGFGISRYTLDNTLYKIALQKNVTVLTQSKVTDIKFIENKFIVSTSSGNFNAIIAAGSFGKRSNLDIKWNRSFIQKNPNKLNNFIGIKYHVQYPMENNTISLHNFKNGYCGISKIEENKCCLCYLTTADNLKNNNNSVQQMEQNILFKNPHLKKIFTEAISLYDQPLAISQISFSKKSQVENHVLMIGDAAGMITPLCGNGMSMAMHGSKISFENIDDFLQGNITREQMEENYTNQWQQAFERRLQIGRNVQRFFGGNISTTVFFKIMNSFPWLAKKVIASTHGDFF
ncbi:MAG: NAD(P)/FAD-dependent oxidoreductase [Chitinophagaceae bacterium]